MGGNPGKKQEAGRAWITVWALVEGMGAGVGCHAAKFSCSCAGFGGLCGGNTLLHCSSNRAFRVLLGKEDFIITTSFLLANPQGMPLLMPASE